jgi:hypothetical protein
MENPAPAAIRVMKLARKRRRSFPFMAVPVALEADAVMRH